MVRHLRKRKHRLNAPQYLLQADWSLDQMEREAQRAKREHFKNVLDEQVAAKVKSVDVMTASERAMNRQLLQQQQTSIL